MFRNTQTSRILFALTVSFALLTTELFAAPGDWRKKNHEKQPGDERQDHAVPQEFQIELIWDILFYVHASWVV